MANFIIQTSSTRRIRELRIEVEDWLDFLRRLDGDAFIPRGTALPEDARVVGLTITLSASTVNVFVESAAFEEVAEGTVPPRWNIAFSRLEKIAGSERWEESS